MPTNELAVVQNAIQFIDKMATAFNSFSEALIKTVQAAASNPAERVMAKQMKEGNVHIIPMPDAVEKGDGSALTQAEAKAVVAQLKNEGVEHTLSFHYGYGEQWYVAVMKEDLEKALPVVGNIMQGKERSGIVSAVELGAYANDGKIKGIDADAETMMMIEQRCIQSKIPIAVDGPDNGKYLLMYAEKDSRRMNSVLLSTAYDMTGKEHEILKEQLKWVNKNQTALANAVIHSTDLDGKPIQIGSAIVGRDGLIAEFRKNSVVLHEGNGDSTRLIQRGNENYEKEMTIFLGKAKEAVFLNPEQYKQMVRMSETECADYLCHIERENGRPVLSKDEMDTIAEAEVKRKAIECKLAQGYYNSALEPQRPYDDLQSLYGFKNDEMKAYEERHDYYESQFSDADILDDARAESTGVSPTIRTKMEDIKEVLDEFDPIDCDQVLAECSIRDKILGDSEEYNYVQDDITPEVDVGRIKESIDLQDLGE